MSSLHPLPGAPDAQSRAVLEERITDCQLQLAGLTADADLRTRAAILLDMGEALVELERGREAWDAVRPLLEPLVEEEAWQEATELCDVLYRCDQDDSIRALGHGVWLAVTYPIKAQTSIALLQHIIDETPEKSDGAAVAAMLAHYLAGLRTEGRERESLQFLTTQIISSVARRHRGIEDQDTLDIWIEVLQLNDVPLLLQRMGRIVETIVGAHWWFDRDILRQRLPIH